MKKFLAIFLCIILCCSCFCACSTKSFEDNGKINIVTSCFPAFDFARQLCGESANITMLLKPGQEAHDFEPTPADIISIQNCDLLICVGGENEKWVDSLTDKTGELNIIKMLTVVNTDDREHTHSHESDEHVWTSPINAKKIVEAIYSSLCKITPENSNTFKQNFDSYNEKLDELDSLFKTITERSQLKTVVFADRFPVRYFTDEYSLKVISAFPGCSSQTEPNASAVTDIIEKVKSENIPAVFYTEFSNEKMADTVCAETGCKKLLFHSCHNVTKEEFSSGETYYSLMQKNAESLKIALGN